jgi:hypothetical protein
LSYGREIGDLFEQGACLRHSGSSGGVTSFGQDGAQRPRNPRLIFTTLLRSTDHSLAITLGVNRLTALTC